MAFLINLKKGKVRGNERGKNAEVLDGPRTGMSKRNSTRKMLSNAKDTFLIIFILSDCLLLNDYKRISALTS